MRALIFGGGINAQKYINLLFDIGYNIDIVTNKTLFVSEKINNSYLYEEFLRQKINYSVFDIIIVSVRPITNQTEIIKYLIGLELENKIILEKPVTYDLQLLNDLLKHENITYNIEELYLSSELLKLFDNKQNIKVDTINKDYNIEHAIGIFLLDKSFKNYLDKIIFNFKKTNDSKLNYDLYLNDNLLISCKDGVIFHNSNVSLNLNSFKSFEFNLKLLLANKNLNFLFKYNFLLLKKSLLKNQVEIDL
ncbi:MAG: hypothetical protein PHQ95_04085 [Candidatus Gracilibacteria bacterium]|nr:hypothetical protein [Candidatus Gracilibacteria bacterium]